MEFFSCEYTHKYGRRNNISRKGPFSTYEEAKIFMELQKKENKDLTISYELESVPIHPLPRWALEQLTVDRKYDPMWGGIAYDREVTTKTFSTYDEALSHRDSLNKKWSTVEVKPGRKYHFNVVKVCPHCEKWS